MNGIKIKKHADGSWLVKAGALIVKFCDTEEQATELKKAIDACYAQEKLRTALIEKKSALYETIEKLRSGEITIEEAQAINDLEKSFIAKLSALLKGELL